MNPKTNPLYLKEEKKYEPSSDYPRITEDIAKVLIGIRKFKETIQAWRN